MEWSPSTLTIHEIKFLEWQNFNPLHLSFGALGSNEWFVHLKKLSLNFSSLSLVIRVNLLHP